MIDEKINLAEVPAEALRRAKLALVEHASAFWTRRPGAALENRADVEYVIRQLRHNGNLKAWRTARAIEECL